MLVLGVNIKCDCSFKWGGCHLIYGYNYVSLHVQFFFSFLKFLLGKFSLHLFHNDVGN